MTREISAAAMVMATSLRHVRRITGAGTRSIITLTQAGLPLASARSSAGPSSAALVTNSPCPPSACATRS